ncbi:LacI family DNA-binding transcriptional regulator [Actinospica robiniae]|uniref:LacI family DNA-binding transcriptional regulator n=1 Tax=Actinospica robiniae TaxID=304901 RepID=UPI0004048CD2|nr:LacI family DNA-binding transcriptional regulator [Actinospica robiniae]
MADTAGDGTGPRAVTIASIAQSAGVSVPTVSKVLNGRSGVSPETRARIEGLIDQYGYRRPPHRSNVVELVFRELETMWAVEIIRGVERVARRNRVGVVVSGYGREDSDGAGSPVEDTVERRPHAVLSVARLSERERGQLTASRIPFVVFDPVDELPDDVAFVGATNWRGGRSATRHLIDLGHRRVAMISGPDHAFCRARQAGYTSAMAAAGLAVDPELVVSTQLTREAGCAAGRALLALAERPTAIFAANDMQALGVYQAAREAGLAIPADLSVVGFDDLPVVAWMDPPLTSVHQPLAEMAAAATELALALGRGEPAPQLGMEIATTLAVRASTAPPPGAPRPSE